MKHEIASDKFLSAEEREDAFLAISSFEEEAKANTSEKNQTKKYNSTFDIPVRVQNYTDSHNKTHPIWAKNMFTKEYTSFDEIFVPWNDSVSTPLTSNQIYEHYVYPHAKCLHNCYYNTFRSGKKIDKDAVNKYVKCKMGCYRDQVNMIEELK